LDNLFVDGGYSKGYFEGIYFKGLEWINLAHGRENITLFLSWV